MSDDGRHLVLDGGVECCRRTGNVLAVLETNAALDPLLLPAPIDRRFVGFADRFHKGFGDPDVAGTLVNPVGVVRNANVRLRELFEPRTQVQFGFVELRFSAKRLGAFRKRRERVLIDFVAHIHDVRFDQEAIEKGFLHMAHEIKRVLVLEGRLQVRDAEGVQHPLRVLSIYGCGESSLGLGVTFKGPRKMHRVLATVERSTPVETLIGEALHELRQIVEAARGRP